MCTGLELALVAGATGLGAAADYSAVKKKDKLAASGIRDQAAKRREAASLVNNEIGRRETSRPDVAGTEQDLMASLRGKLAPSATPNVGGSAYRERSAAADASVGDYGSQLAQLFARTDAPQTQRREEGFSQARTGTALGQVQDAAAGDAATNRMRVESTHANPWIKMLAKGGAAAASAYAGRTPASVGGDTANMAQWQAALDNGGVMGRPLRNQAPGAWGALA